MARMLATDLDGTFLGDDEAMGALWDDLERAGIVVVFSTGRHLAAIHDFYRRAGTSRRAAACVCMVGTEIFVRDGDAYTPAGWDPVGGSVWDPTRVGEIAASLPELIPQDAEWQSAFKSSWFLDSGSAAVVEELRRRLEAASINAKIVHSSGRYLDVIPASAGKGKAVAWLADHLGIAAADVTVAGDSGNDLDMMRPALGFRAIAVGNAQPELRRVVQDNLYHAGAPHARGVREGLEHFGWL